MYKRKWQKSLIEGYKSSNFSLNEGRFPLNSSLIEGFFALIELYARFLL